VSGYADLLAVDAHAPNLVIAGRGRPQADLVELIQRLGLTDRVRLECDLTRQELVSLLRSSSALLLSSYEEGLGLTVIEGMSCGLPVVATETFGSRMTVDPGVTGILVKQLDEASVVPALAQALVTVRRPEVGARYAVNARQRAQEHFSDGVTLARFTSTYERLLAPDSGARRK
jgi:glycosyltransferase involved in cell wall biosynthesis